MARHEYTIYDDMMYKYGDKYIALCKEGMSPKQACEKLIDDERKEMSKSK